MCVCIYIWNWKTTNFCESIKLIAVAEWATDTMWNMVCVTWLGLRDRVNVRVCALMVVGQNWFSIVKNAHRRRRTAGRTQQNEHNNYTYWILARTKLPSFRSEHSLAQPFMWNIQQDDSHLTLCCAVAVWKPTLTCAKDFIVIFTNKWLCFRQFSSALACHSPYRTSLPPNPTEVDVDDEDEREKNFKKRSQSYIE